MPVLPPSHLDDQPVLLLRAEEVARRLSISRAAVYRLLASATIPSVRIGGSRRVTIGQLQRYVETLEQQ